MSFSSRKNSRVVNVCKYVKKRNSLDYLKCRESQNHI